MKIKHFAGYGSVNAVKVKDKTCLHIRASGNHERGLEPYDDYDVWHWLVMRFKKGTTFEDYYTWKRNGGHMEIESSYDYNKNEEVCDYKIYFGKEV